MKNSIKASLILSSSLLMPSLAFSAVVDLQWDNAVQGDGGDFQLEGTGYSGENPYSVSGTFSNAFGAGLDLGVSVSGTSARNEFTDITSAPAPGLAVIGDGFGERFSGAQTITLTLAAGQYDFTSWHHMDAGVAGFVNPLTIEIDTGSGFSTLSTGVFNDTASDTPTTIAAFSTSFTANGTDSVVLRYTKPTDVFVTNGFEITAVPEPSTYALLAGALALAGVMIRRRLRA